jgi:hypothetical protein
VVEYIHKIELRLAPIFLVSSGNTPFRSEASWIKIVQCSSVCATGLIADDMRESGIEKALIGMQESVSGQTTPAARLINRIKRGHYGSF